LAKSIDGGLLLFKVDPHAYEIVWLHLKICLKFFIATIVQQTLGKHTTPNFKEQEMVESDGHEFEPTEKK
jgi:hypothetical protein